jgi:hypothetical protein
MVSIDSHWSVVIAMSYLNETHKMNTQCENTHMCAQRSQSENNLKIFSVELLSEFRIGQHRNTVTSNSHKAQTGRQISYARFITQKVTTHPPTYLPPFLPVSPIWSISHP